jgi:hypothetical protein
MSDENRDRQSGRFLLGNPGGPGRPRRAVEADYLAALSDRVPLESWRAIVAKAREQAESGDAKVREWLATYLVGRSRDGALLDLAASELAGYDPVEAQRGSFDLRKALLGALA